jgi:hypothetical protein
MADTGWGVQLPTSWQVPEGGWSDWSLKAKHPDGSVLQIWVTPFQIPITEDNVSAWAEMYREQIAAEAKAEVNIQTKSIIDIAGRKTGHVTLEVVVQGGKGVAEVYAVEGPGHTVHARVITGKRKARSALSALKTVLETARVDTKPSELTTGTLTSKDANYSVTLPDGWRAPLDSESDEVGKIVGKLGIESIDDKVCVVGVYPRANANPDLTLLCPAVIPLDPLDEYSFDAIEAHLHQQFFGGAKTEVPTGEAVTVGDRMGVYFRPPTAAGALRLSVTPFEHRALTWWGVGGTDGATLDAALMKMQPTVQFTGPDGGKPVIRADRWAAYYLSYRPTSPFVLLPGLLLLGLVGGAVVATRRKKNPYEDDDDLV